MGICHNCNGRGFQWVKGEIVSRRNGQSIANTYAHGPRCNSCLGSGQVENAANKFSRYFAYVAIAFAAVTIIVPGFASIIGGN